MPDTHRVRKWTTVSDGSGGDVVNEKEDAKKKKMTWKYKMNVKLRVQRVMTD